MNTKLIVGKAKTEVLTSVVTVSALLIDAKNDANPHVFDPISPIIENNWGNVWYSMAIIVGTETAWKHMIRPRVAKSKSEAWLAKADLGVALFGLGLVALANVGFETWQLIKWGANPEFGPDVKLGVGLAGILDLVYLVPALLKTKDVK